VHLSAPRASEKVPGEQGAQGSDPEKEKLPGEQRTALLDDGDGVEVEVEVEDEVPI